MKMLTSLLLVIFAFVTVIGHGSAQPLDYHPHAHHDHGVETGADADHATVVIPISVDGTSCPDERCDPGDTSQSGAHFHISCCNSFVALLPNSFVVGTAAVLPIEHSITPGSVALGELSYPLLRPPRSLV